MSVTRLAVARSPSTSSGISEEKYAELQELRQRMHRMQGMATSQSLTTASSLSELIQLRTGASYAVDRPSLAMLAMAGPSAAGAWSAVIGVGDFGLEAAAALGVDLDRTVLIPDPGDSWLEVTAALTGVVGVLVVQPPGRATQHQAARMAARLRQHDTVLIAIGDWPRAEARLSLRHSSWTGIGRGFGRLTGQRMDVVAELSSGHRRQAELWLPGGGHPEPFDKLRDPYDQIGDPYDLEQPQPAGNRERLAAAGGA